MVARQYRIGKYIFDLLFEDRHGAKLIVEIQKGTLDRSHTYKILDYYHEYKENNLKTFIDLMVIANVVPDERKRRLSNWGIAYKEIDAAIFLPGIDLLQKTDTILIDDVNMPVSNNGKAIQQQEGKYFFQVRALFVEAGSSSQSLCA